MENTYAQVLWKLAKDGMNPADAVKKLRTHLKARGRENLLPRIGRALARLMDREGRKERIVLSVAREKDAHYAEREAKDFLKELGVSGREVTVDVDETLIGGWRLEGRERLVDASFKKSLLSIYNRSTQ